jgi:NTE family protein
MVVRGNRVFENSGLKKVIEHNLPGARFEDSQIPLAIVATELETGNEKLFTSGGLLQPLLASAALPSVFPPITIDGTVYIDGGVANNVPIAPAVALGAKTLYVMDATSHSHQRRPLERPMDYLLHAFTLARSQRLGIDLAAFSEKVRIEMVPLTGIGEYIPFASMSYSKRLIESGYRDAIAYLDSRKLRAEVAPLLPVDPAVASLLEGS